MNKIVRFGIVGCGVIAATHADAIRQLDSAELVACYDNVPVKASTFAHVHDIDSAHTHRTLESFLSDHAVDAVSICTPSGTHAIIGVEALLAGKPAIIEKPVDITLESIDALAAAQRKTSLTVSVVSQHRFDESAICAQRLIKTGKLGQPILSEAQVKWYRTQEYYDSGDWRGTFDLDGGGALMNQGIHTVDLMLWLMGPIDSVYAVSRTMGHERIEVEDALCATVTFKGGAIGNIVASTAAYPGYPAQFSIHGTAGSIVISGDGIASLDLMKPSDADIPFSAVNQAEHAIQVAQGGTKTAEFNKQIQADPVVSIWGDAHRVQIADFIDSIQSGRKPQVGIEEGRAAVALILAIYESARSGSTVTLA